MSLTLASETVPSAAQTAAPTAMSRAVAILAVFIMLARGFGACATAAVLCVCRLASRLAYIYNYRLASGDSWTSASRYKGQMDPAVQIYIRLLA